MPATVCSGGIATPERARLVGEGLVGVEMFSGWGIRTVAPTELRYNPMSYHNGSVWPHDNGMIAAGLSRYHLDDLIAAPLGGLFDASARWTPTACRSCFAVSIAATAKVPRSTRSPCSPQAWASGVVFHFIQACLRLSVDADRRRFTIDRAILPPFLTFLRLRDLMLPFGTIDLLFEQHPLDVR
jgi:glycogen debranching enzyme